MSASSPRVDTTHPVTGIEPLASDQTDLNSIPALETEMKRLGDTGPRDQRIRVRRRLAELHERNYDFVKAEELLNEATRI